MRQRPGPQPIRSYAALLSWVADRARAAVTLVPVIEFTGDGPSHAPTVLLMGGVPRRCRRCDVSWVGGMEIPCFVCESLVAVDGTPLPLHTSTGSVLRSEFPADLPDVDQLIER